MKLILSVIVSSIAAAVLSGCGGDGHDSDSSHHDHDGGHSHAEGNTHAHNGDGPATAPSGGTVNASAASAGTLVPGTRADLTLTLTDMEGKPLNQDDFEVVHTQPIHLLIIDETLTDYHHEHPVPTSPGKYTFSFTPRKAGSYRIWADVVPVSTGSQEYAIANDVGINAGGVLESSAEPVLTQTVDGLKYELSFDTSPIKTGEPTLGSLKILGADGAQFDQLEPLMGAFAHIVAFYPDRKTLAHVHPMGTEPTSDSDRGAGALEFHLMPEKSGLIRLFAQIKIGGNQKFIPFQVPVIQ